MMQFASLIFDDKTVTKYDIDRQFNRVIMNVDQDAVVPLRLALNMFMTEKGFGIELPMQRDDYPTPIGPFLYNDLTYAFQIVFSSRTAATLTLHVRYTVSR